MPYDSKLREGRYQLVYKNDEGSISIGEVSLFSEKWNDFLFCGEVLKKSSQN